jgi:antitoxin component YwqK of YwqJK toxin-antitoxin module
MKLIKTLLTILFISLLSSPSWSMTVFDLVEREGIYYQRFTDVPFTGEIIRGLEQGSFKNGKRDGAWVNYYDNGGLMDKGNYKNGKAEGASVGYYENGQLMWKGNYKNGKREGAWVSYNKGGTVWERFSGTFKDGVKISD